ncbi:hypothetical protein CREGCYN_15960 [Synechococcus sp. M16CYN]
MVIFSVNYLLALEDRDILKLLGAIEKQWGERLSQILCLEPKRRRGEKVSLAEIAIVKTKYIS